MDFKSNEEFVAARQRFFETHPEAPEAKDVECLNLIMRREFAEQIIAGTKKLEYRAYSQHYMSRLIDQEVSSYMDMHADDEEVQTFCNDIRQVQRIHFHNYNNSWYLDVECTYNGILVLNKAGIDMLHEEFGCHDWDNEFMRLERANEKARPVMFFFECGKVIDTDLR